MISFALQAGQATFNLLLNISQPADHPETQAALRDFQIRLMVAFGSLVVSTMLAKIFESGSKNKGGQPPWMKERYDRKAEVVRAFFDKTSAGLYYGGQATIPDIVNELGTSFVEAIGRMLKDKKTISHVNSYQGL